MGLFTSSEGGFMDVIRCDEPDYLVWKWNPSGNGENTKKENAIRYGSSLRVKQGEVAVFVYSKDGGEIQDFIVGPHDETIKTANFPILSNIVGTAFGGQSPFQAEVYFINISGNNQLKFGIPYFDVFDPRFNDFSVPVAVRGTLTFNLTDYRTFIQLNRLIEFNKEDLFNQIKDAITKRIKQVVTNLPSETQRPVIQLERNILEVNERITPEIQQRLSTDFGLNLKALDISAIEIDKESEDYQKLLAITANQVTKTIDAQSEVNIKNLVDTQEINAQNLEETLRVQREEAQRAQKLQTETNFINTHALNQQADVLKTAAGSLGTMGQLGGEGSGMNPAGMMTGMALGGAMGNQMAGMMNQMGQNINQNQQNPPPLPTSVSFFVVLNGQQAGPFSMAELTQLVSNSQLTKETHVWKAGMGNWEKAESVPDLSMLFAHVPPPIPPII
ncbi:MAG: SPFH domain-containing protein [Crocinitomicaceae bacterium]|nr:SPFH domain-containing protein [Crocinitomicaceae bacterium]MCF8410440.1 SPFH domain-containing protein [Crocinitomicaceae bacterium]